MSRGTASVPPQGQGCARAALHRPWAMQAHLPRVPMPPHTSLGDPGRPVLSLWPLPCPLAPCAAHLCLLSCLSPAYCPVCAHSPPCPFLACWLLAGSQCLPVSPPILGNAVPREGHPVSVLPVSCPTGGFLCLTTRSNPSNLRYKVELEAALGQLEQRGAWQKLLAQEVEYWERATTEEESTQGTGYISGVVYIYQKSPVPNLEEG
uniref:Uncharacterized protein n=1 Tax=Serinus canaria TaxID=9135 RepID=A0A8C9MM44_SERCA